MQWKAHELIIKSYSDSENEFSGTSSITVYYFLKDSSYTYKVACTFLALSAFLKE